MGATRGRSQKSAIRVCGDWSEQLSSKGKIYFYNCITEVSQWQKPTEWKLPDMDHDELLKLLGNRDQLQTESKNSKRPRVATSTSTHNSRDSFESRCTSPKRGKFCNEARYKSGKSTPSVENSTHRSAYPIDTSSRNYNQRFRGNARISPRKNNDNRGSSVGFNLPSRRQLLSVAPKVLPADDMEISPGSSPMSSGSSPPRTSEDLSPTPAKCSRSNTHTKPINNNHKSREGDSYCGNTRQEDPTSGTLRRLMNVIRASVGGLLEQSTNTTGPNQSQPPGVSLGDRHTQPSCPVHRPSSFYPTEMHSPIVHTSVAERVARPQTHTSNSNITDRLNCTFPHAPPMVAPEEQSVRLPNRTVPGLVSTLTTLVGLMQNAKYSMTSTGDSPRAPTVSSSLLGAPNIQRIPTHASHSSRHCHTASPAIPSPLTPSMLAGTQSSGGSSSNTPMTVNNACDVLTQRDDLVSMDSSSLRPKSSADCYARSKQTFSSDQMAMTHSEYSNRDLPSRVPTNYSCTSRFRLPDNKNQTQGRSVCSFDTRPSSTSPEGVHYRRAPTEAQTSEDSYNRHNATSVSASKHPSDSPCRSPYPGSTNDYTIVKSDLSEGLSSTTPSTNSFRERLADKHISPDQRPSDDDSLGRISRILSSATTQAFVDPALVSRFTDKTVERLEQEAIVEAKKFDKLQSVLYGELSAESKKLRALVRISEAKLALHREKQTSLQSLMDAIETRKQLPNMSFSDDVL